MLTNSYVSTKGGRIDPKQYVIPVEAIKFLTKNITLLPFNEEEINKSILYYTIYRIKDEVLPVQDIERRRNIYWNLLRVLPFDESTIEDVINTFTKEEITSTYSKITNEDFLFIILDETRYDLKLEECVDDFITDILSGEVQPTILSSKQASQHLETHSKLFISIGVFEIRLRNYILNEIKTRFKDDVEEWHQLLKNIPIPGGQHFQTIYEKLEFRKNDDVKNKRLPEEDLISYSDITDYKDIILNNWRLFESKLSRTGLSKQKFEHGMQELNNLRRKVMHLRHIPSSEEKTFRLYILPELEKLLQ